MAYSFSSISSFQECPRKYHETRILKLHPVVETEAMRWGTEIHLKCEEYLRDGKPIGETGIPALQDILDSLKGLEGGMNCELEMSFDRNFNPTPFRTAASWFNGITDVAVINRTRAFIGDFKTGGDKYPKVKQLELMALMIMLHIPEVQTVDGALLFVVPGTIVNGSYKRSDIEKYKNYWMVEAGKIESSEQVGIWPAKSSGLCPWCPCEDCEHHRPKPKGRT